MFFGPANYNGLRNDKLPLLSYIWCGNSHTSSAHSLQSQPQVKKYLTYVILNNNVGLAQSYSEFVKYKSLDHDDFIKWKHFPCY